MQILEFVKAMEKYPLHSNGLVTVPKSLADIVESTIGALFMDCNCIETVWKVTIYTYIISFTIRYIYLATIYLGN